MGSDPAGIARYAFLRGTYGQFKKDVDGSDKQYGFYLPAADRGSPHTHQLNYSSIINHFLISLDRGEKYGDKRVDRFITKRL